ncbi:hypothetical protein HPB50_008882 [Hyalomma asiaticum]|uniref:Uncharacterized protein n=1 Tax=Hyalomma asiaticum TaxID=266040 RepID=A0ACB7SM37_HYAAI|nr:hypothetical protein HPB50_008882 [Hyalomma asiaticum]
MLAYTPLTVPRGMIHTAVRGRRPAIIPWKEMSATHRESRRTVHNDDATIKTLRAGVGLTLSNLARRSSQCYGVESPLWAGHEIDGHDCGGPAASTRRNPTDAHKARWERGAAPA